MWGGGKNGSAHRYKEFCQPYSDKQIYLFNNLKPLKIK